MAAYHTESHTDSALKPVLPDSVAAIALPVFYAEQLHGILYVESATPSISLRRRYCFCGRWPI